MRVAAMEPATLTHCALLNSSGAPLRGQTFAERPVTLCNAAYATCGTSNVTLGVLAEAASRTLGKRATFYLQSPK